MMRLSARYLGIVFIAAVIIPSVLLAVLSIRAASREEAFIEKQLSTTLTAEVTHVAGLASSELDRMALHLREGIELPADGDLRSLMAAWKKREPLVGVPFLLSPRYGVLWPRGDLDEAQRRFLLDNGDFLSDRASTSVFQNIAVVYGQEVLAAAKKQKVSGPATGGDANAAKREAVPAEEQASVPEAKDKSAARAAPNASSSPLSSGSIGRQEVIDAFAQSEAVQAQVYEKARESGDRLAARNVKPFAKSQSAEEAVAPQSATVADKENAGAASGNEPEKALSFTDDAPSAAPARSAAPAEAKAAASDGAGSAGTSAGKAAAKPAAVKTVPAKAPSAAKKDAAVPVQERSQYIATSRLLSQIASQGDYGIIPRFTGERLTFLFWERQRDGRIVGCQVDGACFRDRIASVMPGTYSTARIITILDETGAPLMTPPGAPSRDWRRPFVSREIGESLPRWEVAAYLTDPDAIAARARSSSLTIWILVLILVVSVAGGGAMVLSSVYGEMRLAQKKATFVTNVSHELKTPLTSITLFIELLRQKRQPDPDKRERYLSLMASETERLTRLINNVLDFSATERGKKRYEMRDIDAASVVREIVESQRVRLESRGFQVRLAGAAGQSAPGGEGAAVPAHPTARDGSGAAAPVAPGATDSPAALARADAEAVKQIILNLLSNAEKYSPERKEIEVEVLSEEGAVARGSRRTDVRNNSAAPASGGMTGSAARGSAPRRFVAVHVRDRGVGVAEKDRERIFREFYRVDDSLSARAQGTGLGLAIARRIARDHGGDIECRARQGGGSDFVVLLPRTERGGA